MIDWKLREYIRKKSKKRGHEGQEAKQGRTDENGHTERVKEGEPRDVGVEKSLKTRWTKRVKMCPATNGGECADLLPVWEDVGGGLSRLPPCTPSNVMILSFSLFHFSHFSSCSSTKIVQSIPSQYLQPPPLPPQQKPQSPYSRLLCGNAFVLAAPLRFDKWLNSFH